MTSSITRHPKQQVEIERCVPDRSQAAIAETLADLEGSGRAHVIERDGSNYWRAANADTGD